MGDQHIDIDANLAFWVAVVGVNADHLQLPGSPWRRDVDGTADRELHAPGQLFADERRVTGPKPVPGICACLKQRPAIPVGDMIGKTENFNWRATDLRLGPATGQDRLHLRTLA